MSISKQSVTIRKANRMSIVIDGEAVGPENETVVVLITTDGRQAGTILLSEGWRVRPDPRNNRFIVEAISIASDASTGGSDDSDDSSSDRGDLSRRLAEDQTRLEAYLEDQRLRFERDHP